jgi:hypothetical protein
LLITIQTVVEAKTISLKPSIKKAKSVKMLLPLNMTILKRKMDILIESDFIFYILIFLILLIL